MWLDCVLFLLAAIISNAVRCDNVRNKRQDFWSWGLVEDEPKANMVTEQIPTPLDEEAAVCVPYAPALPDFHTPGRRISETKCYEYAWQMKLRDERDQREKMCQAYNRRKAGLRPLRNLIVGGHRVLTGEYPHMAAIGWKAVEGTWIFKCGGALISSRFVLTAGHCTRSARDTTVAQAEPKIVRLGVRNIATLLSDEQPRDETIVRIIVHPSYAPPRKYNDVALLQLSRDVAFSKHIQPACLWSSGDLSSIGAVTVTGWGTVQEAGRETSPDLLTAAMDIINTTTCDGLLRRYCNRLWCGLQNSQLCAGKLEGGVDTCQGDSGGPLQTRITLADDLGSPHAVVGVTSFGFGCARAAAPGIYTRVAAFVPWIEQLVWN